MLKKLGFIDLWQRLRPWLIVIISIFFAALVMRVVTEYLLPYPPTPLLYYTTQIALATCLSRIMGLSWHWGWVHLAIIVMLVALQQGWIVGWMFPVGFMLLLSLYWNTAKERVPLYLTNRKTHQALSELAERHSPHSFIDLGCGFNGAALYLSKHHPPLACNGAESAPLPFVISWLRSVCSGRKNIAAQYKNIWDVDLSHYDMVYCFLSPVPMPRLYDKARAEMRPGSIFISNSFIVPDHPADEIIHVQDGRKTLLYVWVI